MFRFNFFHEPSNRACQEPFLPQGKKRKKNFCPWVEKVGVVLSAVLVGVELGVGRGGLTLRARFGIVGWLMS